MATHKKLFGNNIAPSCACCHFGTIAPDGKMIQCSKRGLVAPVYKCNKFTYDPLKRVPKRLPPLPTFSPEDFDL